MAFKKSGSAVFFLLLFFLSGECFGKPSERTITLRLFSTVKVQKVAVAGGVSIFPPGSKKERFEAYSLGITPGMNPEEIRITGRPGVFSGIIRMEPETTVIITVNGRHSKRIDSVFTIRNTGEGLILLTELPLEQYLAGVLAGEMGSAPFQTLKAQAVACRTFTLKKIEESEGKPRVFLDSTLDQHYAGYFGPESVFFKAVAETRGEVLICRGRLLESLYHSTCGGHTAKPVYVFENHISGLSAVKDTLSGEKTALCSKSPHFRWEYRLKNSVLDKILIKEAIGNRLGRVENLSVTKYEPDGRALNMEISGSDGRYRMRAYHFWQMVGDHIGWGKIRSTFFRVKKSGDCFVFTGRGLGHGLGLCQWGAMEMGRRGRNYREILRHYYPSMEITKRR